MPTLKRLKQISMPGNDNPLADHVAAAAVGSVGTSNESAAGENPVPKRHTPVDSAPLFVVHGAR